VSVVMPSSLEPGGARTHPADWSIGVPAGPISARWSSRFRMLPARTAPCPAAAASCC